MNSQAIRPSFYREYTEKVDEIAEEVIPDEKQQALAYITHFKGWELMKEYKDTLQRFLDDSLSAAIANGANMSEIGERALVKEIGEYILNSFIKKAEDARRNEEK